MEVNYDLIKKARKAKGMTQDDVVAAVRRLVGQFSQSAYVKIEKGLSRRSRFLPAVCRVLDLDLSEVDESLAITTEEQAQAIFNQIDELPLEDQVRVAQRVFEKLAEKDQAQ